MTKRGSTGTGGTTTATTTTIVIMMATTIDTRPGRLVLCLSRRVCDLATLVGHEHPFRPGIEVIAKPRHSPSSGLGTAR
jgi:hypothetical protein